jgi:hypothetical protein
VFNILLAFFGQEEILAGNRSNFLRFYNLYPVHYTDQAVPAPIVSTFVVHTVAEALQATAFNLALQFVLEFKTVTEWGKNGVTELK